MISKEEYKVLLHCKDEPQEQEKGKENEYADLAFKQLLFRSERGSITLYKTNYDGLKAVNEYKSERRNKIIALITLMFSAVSVAVSIIGLVV